MDHKLLGSQFKNWSYDWWVIVHDSGCCGVIDEDRSSYTTPIVRNMYVGRFAYFKRNKLRIKCK